MARANAKQLAAQVAVRQLIVEQLVTHVHTLEATIQAMRDERARDSGMPYTPVAEFRKAVGTGYRVLKVVPRVELDRVGVRASARGRVLYHWLKLSELPEHTQAWLLQRSGPVAVTPKEADDDRELERLERNEAERDIDSMHRHGWCY